MRLVFTFVGVLVIGMVITAALGGTRSATKAPIPQHNKSDSRLGEKILANPALAARLQPLVPAGMTLVDAAIGFATETKFIAALYLSRSLKIPFSALKAEATGSDHDTLRQAVRALRPRGNEKDAVRAAERQAIADIQATQSTQPNMNNTDN